MNEYHGMHGHSVFVPVHMLSYVESMYCHYLGYPTYLPTYLLVLLLATFEDNARVSRILVVGLPLIN